jgi:hypothetical protein
VNCPKKDPETGLVVAGFCMDCDKITKTHKTALQGNNEKFKTFKNLYEDTDFTKLWRFSGKVKVFINATKWTIVALSNVEEHQPPWQYLTKI